MNAKIHPTLLQKHCGMKVTVGASVVDSDAEDEDGYVQGVAAQTGDAQSPREVGANTLVYHGSDPVVLEPQDGAWVPVSRASSEVRVICEVVLQLAGSTFEVATGLWDTGGLEGLVLWQTWEFWT